MARDDFDNAINNFEICDKIDDRFIPTSLNLGNIHLRRNEFKK